MNVDPFELAAQLADEVDGQIQTDKPLAPFTSYKIGGPTAVWVAPVTQVGVARALEVIHRKKAPLFILGRGSNLLVSDHGWDGVTLYLGENFSNWTFDHRQAQVLDEYEQLGGPNYQGRVRSTLRSLGFTEGDLELPKLPVVPKDGLKYICPAT